jgi:lipoate-protein ligase A
MSKVNMKLEMVAEEATFDPARNLARDASYWKETDGNRARVWRNERCVVLGRFLEPEAEVYLGKAKEMGIPVLKRTSGGGAVYHDLGNLNYSLYLDLKAMSQQDISESLRSLSYPVTSLLDSLGVSWQWVPPNNVYVEGKKISGSAQARRRGRLLHHGTLLVSCDLDVMRSLLKPGGRSRIAQVINLAEVVPGIAVEKAEGMLAQTALTSERSHMQPEVRRERL